MAAPKTHLPRGPFILWVYYGYEGWASNDYDTLDDAIAAVGGWGSTQWVITEAPVKLVAAGRSRSPLPLKEEDT